MDQQEALKGWLVTAWQKGQQMESLCGELEAGRVTLAEAEDEMMKPIPPESISASQWAVDRGICIAPEL